MKLEAEKAGNNMASVKQAKASTLSAFEIKELTQRMNGGQSATILKPSDVVIEEDDPEQILQRADRIKGVGFDKQHILSMTARGIAEGDGGKALN